MRNNAAFLCQLWRGGRQAYYAPQDHQIKLALVLGVSVDDFYVNSELPVPTNVLLAEILNTVEKLDQPFQLHILRVARSLVDLTHPKSE